jgi:hypothetical protein
VNTRSAESTGFTKYLSGYLNPSIIVALIISLVGFIGAWTLVKAHPEDLNLHHTNDQLNATYMRKDVADERWADNYKRLDRIETAQAQSSQRIEHKIDAIAHEIQEHRITGK